MPGRTHTQAAVMNLAAGRALVILDSREHVAEGAADLCEALLRGCPNVTVLATSRTRLRVPGESDWPVPPLALPSTDAPEEIARSDAGALFVERAARVHFRFALDGGNAAPVARICRDLDGLPLAIELAAARVRMMSPNQVADGVRNRFKLLAGGPRGAAARHETLRASVDWSHDLLSEHQRRLFRRLAVFTGGWSLEAAEAVCAGGALTSDAILDVLAALIDDSLVVVDQHPRAARYRLLETVREYALELLSASGEEAELRERHLDFFLQLSTQARHELETPRVRAWIEALDAETANIDAAIDHAVERRLADALRIGVALIPWWKARAQFGVGQQALSKALAAADASPSVLRARALWSCGYMARFRGDAEAAGEFAAQAMKMAEAVGDDWTVAMSLQTVAFLGMMRDPAGSEPVVERAVERLPGEDVATCVVRELDEETWLHASPEPVRAENPSWALFRLEVPWETEIRLDPGEEHDRFAWVTHHEACGLCLPAVVGDAIRHVAP